jgi:putative transposase
MSDPLDFPLRFFDPNVELFITHRDLPHWYQEGAATLITFRTADSLPVAVLLRVRQELREWLAYRRLPEALVNSIFSTGGTKLINQHFAQMLPPDLRSELSARCHCLIEMSLDECHGKCLLRRPELAKIVADSILHGNGTAFDLDSFIIMPNHVHALVSFRKGFGLSVVGQSWMRFSARRINQVMSQKGEFWQAEPFDHIIRSEQQFVYLQKYIEANPKRACLGPDEYCYWNWETGGNPRAI